MTLEGVLSSTTLTLTDQNNFVTAIASTCSSTLPKLTANDIYHIQIGPARRRRRLEGDGPQAKISFEVMLEGVDDLAKSFKSALTAAVKDKSLTAALKKHAGAFASLTGISSPNVTPPAPAPAPPKPTSQPTISGRLSSSSIAAILIPIAVVLVLAFVWSRMRAAENRIPYNPIQDSTRGFLSGHPVYSKP